MSTIFKFPFSIYCCRFKPFFTTILLGAFLLKASAEPEAPPASPLVGAAPESARWIVAVQQKVALPPRSNDPVKAAFQDRVAKVNPRLLQQTVEKSGDTLHRENDWEDGAKDTFWFYYGYVIFHGRDFQPKQVLVMQSGSPGAPEKPKSDFPELDWITPDVFAGTTEYNGMKCFLYKKTDPDKNIVSAWIDFKTRLPLAIDDKTTLKTYTFSEGPSSLEPDGMFTFHPGLPPPTAVR